MRWCILDFFFFFCSFITLRKDLERALSLLESDQPTLYRCADGREIQCHRGTSLIRNCHPLGPYSTHTPRDWLFAFFVAT